VVRAQAAAWHWGRRGARVNTVSPDVSAAADDVAEAAHFLLGDCARHITGTDLLLDGGESAAAASGHRPVVRSLPHPAQAVPMTVPFRRPA